MESLSSSERTTESEITQTRNLEIAAYLKQMVDLEDKASFNELQADFLADQVKDFLKLMRHWQVLVEEFLPKAGARGKICEIVLSSIRERLFARRDWIFDVMKNRAQLEDHAERKRQAREMDDIPF